MRLNPTSLALLLALLFANPLPGEETPADLLGDPAIQLGRPADRARVVKRMSEIENIRLQNARLRAQQLGLPLRVELPGGRIQELVDFNGERPRYFITHNVNAAISTGANLLRSAPYSLSGSGVTIGLWDGGTARSTHQELTGRVTVMDGATIIDHATHVAGTLIASGVVASAHGMAASATVDSYDWTNDTSEMTSRAATAANQTGKIYLSNHSYGIISGWNYVNGGTPTRLWEWYGSGTTSTSIENEFGLYNSYARNGDSLAFSAPYYLIFRSAGNDRNDNPSTGDAVALSPGSGTVVSYDPASHPAGDGTYRGGFDTIGFAAVAKNVMTIGSVADAVTSGVRDVSKAAVSYFSCWGPTDDGRIKPDVVANGESLYSSIGTGDAAYAYYTGTSMATPNAVGSATLLIQQYSNLFPGQAMRASTLKGLLIHTADDLGNPGPDYKTGWGLLNVKTAADLIIDHHDYPAKQRITENQLTTTTITRTHSFVWNGTSPIIATLCWTDPAGALISATDSRTPSLVNDLNLKVIAPNGTEFFPFVMPFVGTWTQASMDSAATTGINTTDNVEQVRVAAPPVAGTYQVLVSFTGTLTNNSQNYSLILSGTSTVAPPPTNLAATPGNNNVALTWTGSSGATGYTVKRSLTSGGPYTAVGTTATTTYTDATAVNGTTYYYVVSATNASGEGANSGQVSATPMAMPSVTSVTSSPATSGVYGTVVTLTASVTSGATGTVTFYDGITLLGTASLSSGLSSYSTSTLAVGGHSITASYGGDAVYVGSVSSPLVYTVNPKPVTIVGVSAAGKVYDGTATATLSGGTLSGVVSGEAVTVIAGSGVFASANAGTWAVSASGYALGGAQAGNYVLAAQPAVANATIAPRPVQMSGSRTYDGTTMIAEGGLSIPNNIDGANLVLTGNGYLTTKDAGTRSLASTLPAAMVQSQTGNTGSATATTFAVTLSAAPVDGNTLIAVIATRGNSTGRVTAITQTGASWSRAAEAANSNGSTTEIWYAPNVAGAATTVTITQANLRSAAVIMEYRGVLASTPLDQIASATGNGAAAATGTTPTTTQANELWIGGIGLVRATYTLSSILNSFTTIASAQTTSGSANQNAKVYALARIVAAAGTANTGGTISSSSQWSGAIATFKTVTPGFAGSLALTGTAAGNYTFSGAAGTVVVTPKALTLSGLATSDKTYDGTSTAVLTGTAGLLPAVATADGTTIDGRPYVGDAVDLTGTPAGAFADKHVGDLKPVTVSGTALAGAQAANYSLIQPVGLTENVLPCPLTVAAVAVSKIYDGTTTAAGTPTLTPPLAPGDVASVLAQAFQDPNAGAGNKVVIPGIAINDGNGGANYAVTLVNHVTSTILPAPAAITLNGLAQVYDGTPKMVSATTVPEGLPVVITYDNSAIAPTQAGSYQIAATINDPNHAGTATGTLVIGKAAATIALTGLTATYDGTPKPVGATTAPEGLPVAITYDGSATAPANAGTYQIAATINDPNHAGAASGTLLIEKAAAIIDLTGFARTYDGSPKPVSATTTPEGLAVAITYDGSATAPTNAGTYQVVATITDPNHAGTASGTLVIDKAAAAITLTGLTQTYDGSPKPVGATTAPEGLSVAFTYDNSASVPSNAGTYQVEATITDPNHTGAATGTLVIGKAAATIALTGLTQVYDGSPKPVGATTTPEGLSVAFTYDNSATAPTDVGTYQVAATITDTNHTGATSGTLVIGKAAATITLTGLTRTYDGTPKPVGATTTPEGLSVAITYDGSVTAPTQTGTYQIEATIADPNHTGATSGTLVIEKAAATITLTGLVQTYDGTPKPVSATTTPEGLSVVITYDSSATAPTDPGAYQIAATINDPNHAGSASGTLLIEKAVATITLTGLSQAYDGSPKAVGATTVPEGLAVVITYDNSATAPTNAGTYQIVATIVDPIHAGTATGMLSIEKAAATIALTGLASTYDGTPKPVGAATAPEGLSVAITYDGSATAPTQAGAYQVAATITDPNHAGSASATLVIGKAAATITLSGLAQTYEGSPKPVSATTTPEGLSVAFTYDGSATAPTGAGTYQVAATITDPNHAGSASGTLVIEKAAATITITGLTQTYDGSPKPVGATTTPEGLSVAFTYDGSATAPTGTGTYQVAATTTDPNHTGTANGTLVIGKAAATIALTGLAQGYDGLPKPVSATTTPEGLSVAITYDNSATAPADAGTYQISATIVDPTHAGTASGTLVIAKAAATVDLTGIARTYDGSPKPVSATTTPEGLSVAITYDNSATVPTDAGTYQVAATITDPNHAGSASGTLVIEKAAATIDLTGFAQTYDGLPKPVSATTTPEGLSVAITYDNSATVPTGAGTYQVAATITDPNHAGTASGTLVIEKAAATIALTGLARTYDGSPKPVIATTTPEGLSVAVTYDNSATAPTHAGTYQVAATITDPNHAGSASGTLVIEQAAATIALTNLTQVYDGSPKPVSATTVPEGLTVAITYDDSPAVPTGIGTYQISAAINDPDYAGTAAGVLTIVAPTAWAAWCDNHFTEAEQLAGLAADDADPDCDGQSNLVEYALGTDPREFTPALVPTVGPDGISLIFTRPADLPDVKYAAEYSDDLGGWSAATFEVIETGATETLRAHAPPATSEPGRRFLRLRFERN